jgi:Leucine-rich repeat (LRR) protein
MGLPNLGSPNAKPMRPIDARWLGAVLVVAGLSLCAFAAPPSEDASVVSAPTNEAAAAKGELALARLQELGASVRDVDKTGQRKILIGFVHWPKPADILGNDAKPMSWTGDDSDFRLLDKVAALGELDVDIDCTLVSPRALSKLRLGRPLARLSFQSPTNQMFDDLESLPPCRSLRLTAWELTPASFRRLAVLVPGVEALLLVGLGPRGMQMSVGDAEVAELAGLENLTELNLSFSSITEAGLKHLANMKHLEHVHLLNCPALEKSDLTGLVGPDSLRKLELYFPVSVAGLANIARLGSLETLNVGISDFKPADVAPLGQLTHLKELWISQHPVKTPASSPPGDATARGDAIALAAAKALGLQKLALSTTMSESGLKAIVALPHLQSLMIQLAEVDDQSLALVSRLAGLRTLRLYGTGKLSDQGLAHLGKMTQLTELSLPGAGLTDEGLAHLAGLTALKELVLSGSNITGTGLAALDQLKELRTLDLGRSPFNDEGCRRLPQFAQLQTLHLPLTKITDAGLESIAALTDLATLIIFDDKAVTDVGIAHLERLKHLVQLNAWDTAVSETGVHKLEAAIRDIQVDATIDVPNPAGGTMKARIPRRNRAAFNRR